MTIEENLDAIRVGVEATVKLLQDLIKIQSTSPEQPNASTEKRKAAVKAMKPEASRGEAEPETKPEPQADPENGSDAITAEITAERIKNAIKNVVKINRNEAINLLKKYDAANFATLKPADYVRFLFEADKRLKELMAEAELV